jgi:glutamate carboxypeptidase
MLYALQALERSPFAEKIGWQVLINADEEIGSAGSAPLLAAAAPQYHTGLVFEPALTEEGALASHRKGSGNFTAVVRGKAAHAGRALQEGRNAIVALAEIIQAIDKLNGQQPDVTLNVGMVEGGQGLNVVPDLAIARFNVRTGVETDENWVLTEINHILARVQQREGFSVELHGHFTRKPKPNTENMQKLCDFVTETATTLGITVRWQMSGGVCDGNNLAHAGLTTVDTLGVRGGNIHSEQEYICIESLVERAQLTALLLMRLTEVP